MISKKTLIVLALATTTVSGSATAWQQGQINDSINIEGHLTPPVSGNPWEVMLGNSVVGLDAELTSGQTSVDIPVTQNIPVLGIRTISNKAIPGTSGIIPQISYNNALDISKFKDGRAPLTLEVKDSTDNVIGSLTVKLGVTGVQSVKESGWKANNLVYATDKHRVFFGGVPYDPSMASKTDIAPTVFPGVNDNFDNQGLNWSTTGQGASFRQVGATYSGYYGAGIEPNQNISISLNNTIPDNTQVAWKASLPITVTYN
jgi:hypothetical protein